MIDFQRDELINLSELARRLRSSISGSHVNPATTFRWATSGLKGHRLETVHVGGRMLTTMKAYEEFVAAIAAGRVRPSQNEQTPSPRKPNRIRNARQILAAAGIK